MSAIFPKCYQLKGDQFCYHSEVQKSTNSQRKPQYDPKECSDQQMLRKLMGANKQMGECTQYY